MFSFDLFNFIIHWGCPNDPVTLSEKMMLIMIKETRFCLVLRKLMQYLVAIPFSIIILERKVTKHLFKIP